MVKDDGDNMSWDNIMEVEDSLQAAKVFINGISGNTCHSDSYMTVVDFNALNKWKETNTFPIEIINEAIEYWLTNENMQPPLRLVGLTLYRGNNGTP